MPVYFVTGKLGSGKTLSMVGRMRDYLRKGRGVVSNIDINIRELVDKRPELMPIRLPDKPSVDDLLRLGAAHTTCREELNGAIFLDECGTWLNSRGWSDKGRAKLIDWLLHSRKLGWDVFFIIQNAAMMDKQIRDALCEYHVTCKRLDRLKVPFIGGMLKIFSFGYLSGRLPKLHVANVSYGMGLGAFHSETWRYFGHELYPAYSSSQIVNDEGGAVGMEISSHLAFPSAANEAAGAPPVIRDASAMHSLVWYETPSELKRRKADLARKPKPKLPHVERLQGIANQDHRFAAARVVLRSARVRAAIEADELLARVDASSRQAVESSEPP